MNYCSCDWLKNAANDERFPVIYDEQTNHFKLLCQLGGGQQGFIVLHFCPFCGGRAPDVKKEESFARISEQELNRLQELTRQIESLEDALRILGEPELEIPQSIPAELMEQELLETARSLTYTNVSDVAIIHITEYQGGGIRIVFQEKYIGKRRAV